MPKEKISATIVHALRLEYNAGGAVRKTNLSLPGTDEATKTLIVPAGQASKAFAANLPEECLRGLCLVASTELTLTVGGNVVSLSPACKVVWAREMGTPPPIGEASEVVVNVAQPSDEPAIVELFAVWDNRPEDSSSDGPAIVDEPFAEPELS